MKKLVLIAGYAALAACGQRDEAAPAENADVNVAGAEAPAPTPAGFQINETTWEFTSEGKPHLVSVDASGNYVTWSGEEHVNHGTAVVKGDKLCFDNAMDREGETCWTTTPVDIGQSYETTSDKGKKLTVKRVAYTAVPDNVKPAPGAN